MGVNGLGSGNFFPEKYFFTPGKVMEEIKAF